MSVTVKLSALFIAAPLVPVLPVKCEPVTVVVPAFTIALELFESKVIFSTFKVPPATVANAVSNPFIVPAFVVDDTSNV